ncbi:retrovirus-related pol polyprotein from transposon TNT 1-94 [Tanacetum coccineum]
MLNDRKLQIQECKVQEVKAADASSRNTDNSGFISDNGNAHSSENDCSKTKGDQSSEKQSSTSANESNRSGNKCSKKSNSRDDTDIKPSYDTKPMAKADENADDNEDKRVVLANLIANLKLDTDENNKIQKQLKKANASLTHELNECKSALEESNDIQDRCRSALHDQDIELEKYKKYNNCQLEKEEVEHKLIETLGLLAQQEHDLNEVLKTQAYETFQVKEKNTELVHQRQVFVNPKYLKKTQSKQPCLYKIPYDKDDLATYLLLIVKRHSFLRKKEKRMYNIWKQPITQEITMLVKNLVIPLAIKRKANANEFERALKQEMFEDLEYVQSLENEVDELESEKTEFSNEYDLLLQECVSKDIICAILRSFDNINEQTELQCLYLEKIKECQNLEIKLSMSKTQQTDKCFANLEQYCIDLELALQCEKEKNVCENSWAKQSLKSGDTEKDLKEQNDTLIAELNCKTLEINDLKAQLQNKTIANAEMRESWNKMKVGATNDLTKSVTPHSWPQVRKTSFAKPYHVNAPGPSRNSTKRVSFQSPKEFVCSNDIVHDYYLEEAKKKA